MVVVGKVICLVLLVSPNKYTSVNGFVVSSNTVDKVSFSNQPHQRTCNLSLPRLSAAKGQEEEPYLSPREIRLAQRNEKREKREVKRLEIEEAEKAKIEILTKSDNVVEDKFSFGQRIESVKTAVVGLLSGGIAASPVIALHDLVFADQTIVNNSAQWEFDTDMGSLEAALFAIVYRYCIREDDNDMLNMGCIGAFVLVRTLSKVRTPTYCLTAPLSCGAPLEYFDWNMLQQVFWSGSESVLLFGVAAMAMNSCFEKGYISKFR